LQPLLDALTSAEQAVENAFDDTAEAIIDNINSLALPPSLQSKLDEVLAVPSTVLGQLLADILPLVLYIVNIKVTSTSNSVLIQAHVHMRASTMTAIEIDGIAMQISTNYADLRESFQEAPEVYIFLFSLLFGSAGFAYYRNEYGGFSGIYKPTELVEALTKEDNIIVVDVREEEEQEANGILDLRRNARGKAVSLPIVEVCSDCCSSTASAPVSQHILQFKHSCLGSCS
jgi:TfoX/Sxy family transcriptional regulator of competence genes